MKSQLLYSGVVVACLLGLVALLLGRFQIRISFDTQDSESLFIPSNDQGTHLSLSALVPDAAAAEPKPQEAIHLVSGSAKTIKGTERQGGLRVSNQTDQPLRIALLARHGAEVNAVTDTTSLLPAHWDFSPLEGSDRGLILSLPEGNIKLAMGDILVAFAQDGSRRYWGPYVVGESAAPEWNPQVGEWELVLR
jgi:hypothetical protein